MGIARIRAHKVLKLRGCEIVRRSMRTLMRCTLVAVYKQSSLVSRNNNTLVGHKCTLAGHMCIWRINLDRLVLLDIILKMGTWWT